jgi:hypothetical protein
MNASGDTDRDRLRTVVAAIDRGLSGLPVPEGDAAAPARLLRASWAELVELLALGPAPETRACPTCGNVGMRTATRCGHCWSKLSPPAAASTDAPRTI